MNIDDLPLERELTEREKFFEEAHQRFKKEAERIDNMVLTVVKAQIIIERSMIELLEAHGKDPKHFLFTAPKIKECKEKIDPPEVGQPTWELLSLCTHVRNELVHNLDTKVYRIAEEHLLGLLRKDAVTSDVADIRFVPVELYLWPERLRSSGPGPKSKTYRQAFTEFIRLTEKSPSLKMLHFLI